MKGTQVAQSLTLLAPAKLNLSLAILGKMDNGYHELLTLMQSVNLCDVLKFQFASASSVTHQVNLVVENDTTRSDFPLDDTNLIKKAANLFCKTLPVLPPTKIQIIISKNIPIGAGLAGGSSNAAATLLALNEYFGNPMTMFQLLDLGFQLGSDVPFCLIGGTSLGRGRGEKLSHVSFKTILYFVLVKPKDLFVSTAWAYDAFDRSQAGLPHTDLESHNQKLIAHLLNGEISEAAGLFNNDFEPEIFKHHAVLVKIKERLIELGCLSAHMTGSGPTIYGLTQNLNQAEKILASILQDHQLHVDCWLAQSVSYGAKVIENGKD